MLSKGFLVVLLRSRVSGGDHEGHPGIGKGRHPNLRRGRSVGVVLIKNASGHHADPLFEMTQCFHCNGKICRDFFCICIERNKDATSLFYSDAFKGAACLQRNEGSSALETDKKI